MPLQSCERGKFTRLGIDLIWDKSNVIGETFRHCRFGRGWLRLGNPEGNPYPCLQIGHFHLDVEPLLSFLKSDIFNVCWGYMLRDK